MIKARGKLHRDIELQQNILRTLMLHPNLKTAHIEVAVQNGIVTLSGCADSYADKIIARHLTQQFSGIKSIEEKIEVTIPYFLE